MSHEGHGIRLEDGLPETNRYCHVIIGQILKLAGNKLFPGDGKHYGENFGGIKVILLLYIQDHVLRRIHLNPLNLCLACQISCNLSKERNLPFLSLPGLVDKDKPKYKAKDPH